jgi:hypothetical protein
MDSKNNYMKNYIFTLVVVLGCTITALGQNTPSLLIDNVSTQFSNVSLPYWLKAGQTIDIGTNAKSVSILEFTVNGTALEFSQAVALTSSQTVPANKVWKIEGIGLIDTNTSMPSSSTTLGSSTNSVALLPTIFQSPKKFETPGSYNWKVPPGVTSICIEVWGAGGSGGPNGRGGGGGYGYQCFTVVPLTNYIVTVATGGIGRFSQGGGSSSVGNLITASGGDYSGGSGGTSTSISGTLFSINGENSSGGGAGGNGGAGGIEYNQGNNLYSGDNGVAPGGGGGFGSNSNYYYGGNGARGQVYIYW